MPANLLITGGKLDMNKNPDYRGGFLRPPPPPIEVNAEILAQQAADLAERENLNIKLQNSLQDLANLNNALQEIDSSIDYQESGVQWMPSIKRIAIIGKLEESRNRLLRKIRKTQEKINKIRDQLYSMEEDFEEANPFELRDFVPTE